MRDALNRVATVAVAMAAVTTGCLDVADERARFDATVGQAQTDAATIEVEEGQASIRALEPGRLELWAQAPTLTLHVTAAEGGVWEVRARNMLSDAVATRDGVALPVVAHPLPTEFTWSLELEAGQRATVRIEPPDVDLREPWRFVMYADVQDHIDAVQDIYATMRRYPDVRFGLISGDLTESGTRGQMERFQREMETLPFPCYATLGNHELGSDEHMFQRLYGRANSSFAFRGARFTLLDSASATIAPRVHDWLDGWLEAGRGGLHLVMMHIPPLDPVGFRNGAFASRSEANALLARLARADVDMTVYGHVHSYYVYTNAGIDAFITGGGGAFPQRQDGIGRHFLLVEADPEVERFTTSMIRVEPP